MQIPFKTDRYQKQQLLHCSSAREFHQLQQVANLTNSLVILNQITAIQHTLNGVDKEY